MAIFAKFSRPPWFIMSPMPHPNPVKLGVVGLGGYAKRIVDLVLDHGPASDPPVSLSVVCDPDLDAHADLVTQLRQRGVVVESTYETLLTTPGLDAVWLPVPIDLHVPFAQAALDAGQAVMVEKPVAGTIDELDELIAARDAADMPVAVGFQDVYDTQTLPLKRRLLAGDFGRVTRVSVRGCWPRNTDYFNRAAWAGAVKHRGSWVLDSPVNNAMAHFVNIVLFLLGPDEARSATPTSLEAELYRAADIESYDTASLRIQLQDRPDFLVLMTHACDEQIGPVIDIQAERGRVRWTMQDITVEHDGQTQTTPRDHQMRTHMLERFAQLVRGIDNPDRAFASLEVARAHAVVVNGASQATPVVAVPDAHVTPLQHQGATVRSIAGINEIFEHCAAHGQMLHESGRLAFTTPPGTLDLVGYNHFAGLPCTDAV